MLTCWMDVDMEEIKVYNVSESIEQGLKLNSRGNFVLDKKDAF